MKRIFLATVFVIMFSIIAGCSNDIDIFEELGVENSDIPKYTIYNEKFENEAIIPFIETQIDVNTSDEEAIKKVIADYTTKYKNDYDAIRVWVYPELGGVYKGIYMKNKDAEIPFGEQKDIEEYPVFIYESPETN